MKILESASSVHPLRQLGGLTDKSPKSLMRMLDSRGNPQARKGRYRPEELTGTGRWA